LKNAFRIRTVLYAGLHLCVDGLCAYAVFSRLYSDSDPAAPIISFIVYNVVAFVLQPVFGWVVDKFGRDRFWLHLSLIFVVAFAVVPLPYLISALALGLGNGLFHVAGGKYILVRSEGRAAPAGVFVAFGATGLALGTFYASTGLAIGLVAAATSFTLLSNLVPYDDENNDPALPVPFVKRETVWIALLLSTALVRAFLGKSAPTTWTADAAVFVAIAGAATAGKAIGGFLSDWFGIKPTAVASLFLSVILYGVFPGNLISFLLGTLCFNMTMPLTLSLVNRRFPNREAFGFGLVAATLFPGYLLGLLALSGELPFIWILLFGTIWMAVIFVFGPAPRRRKLA